MKTCGTCKHWGGGEDRHGGIEPDSVYRPCRAVIHDAESATDQWNDPGYKPDEDDDPREPSPYDAEVVAIRKHKAVVKDGSDYYAALKTREDFGCVLHEVRERTP